MLDDPESRGEAAPVPEKHQLPRYTGWNESLGFFYLDPIRDVFFFVDDDVLVPSRIFVQERSTGRRLPPLTDPELDIVEERFGFMGACMSDDRHHLAISLQYGNCYYTAVWAIAKKLNFEVEHRTFTWGTKLFSSTVEASSGSFVRPIAFTHDGSLCCPAGRMNVSTGEVLPLPAELLGGRAVRQSSYSEDGQAILRRVAEDGSNKSSIQLYTFEDKKLRSVPLSGIPDQIHYYSSGMNDCEFAIYSSVSTQHERTMLLGLCNGTSNDLDISPLPERSYPCFSFTFYDKDKLLGLVDYNENSFRKTRICVWTGIPFKPYLWATRELGRAVVGHSFDKESSLLYVVYPGRIWARISLESSALVDVDLHIASQTQPRPLRVEHCLSRNGKKLAVLKCWKGRCVANEYSVFEY